MSTCISIDIFFVPISSLYFSHAFGSAVRVAASHCGTHAAVVVSSALCCFFLSLACKPFQRWSCGRTRFDPNPSKTGDKAFTTQFTVQHLIRCGLPASKLCHVSSIVCVASGPLWRRSPVATVPWASGLLVVRDGGTTATARAASGACSICSGSSATQRSRGRPAAAGELPCRLACSFWAAPLRAGRPPA